MKFLLLKILLQRRVRDEGFTLPMVIAIGLIMILLSTVNVVQSSEENLTAISTNSSSDALAMAEVGVTRYRELINNNRVLAVHNHTAWSNFDDTATNPQVCDSDVDDRGDTTQWHTINDGSGNIGEYQLVSYEYDNDGIVGDNNDNGIFDQTSDANNNNARGILTVRGRRIDSSGNEISLAQIQTDIPLGINTFDLDTLAPTLWVQQNNITNLGNLTVTGGNIVLYGTGICDNAPPNLNGQTTIYDPRTVPPIVDITTIANVKDIEPDISDNVLATAGIDDPDDPFIGEYLDHPNGLVLGDNSPENNANALNDDTYYYRANGNLLLSGNENIISDGEAKVVIYVNGNVNIDTTAGDINIENSSGDATSRFLEIHATGNVNISGGNNVNIKGLIHAPNGTLTITNSPTVNIIGSVWVNDWNVPNGVNINITGDDYKFYSTTTQRTPQPLTYRPSEWEKQEAD